jgi:hypothetical protein
LTLNGSARDNPASPLPVTTANLGKVITVKGWAVNRKNGAALDGEGFCVWIHGLNSWPPGYYKGGTRGKKVSVTGRLTEDHGLPVFVQKKGQPWVQGMPVPEGTNLEKASRRFVLKAARWKLLEK